MRGISLFVFAVLGLIFLGVYSLTNGRGFNGDGIVPHPSGQAVLIRGEACVINDVPEVSDEQLMAMAYFCIKNRHK